jgi:hypothetical protein
VSAQWDAGGEATQEITLNGEESISVTLRKP